MKKILFIDQYNKIGGGQTVLIDLINSFTKLGYQCHVAVPEGNYIEENVSNVTFHYLPPLNLNNSKKSTGDIAKLLLHYVKIYSLKRKLKGFNYIYINGPRYFILFYLLSKFNSGNYIYHIHIDFPVKIKSIISKIISGKRTKKVFFTTEYILNEFLNSQHQISRENLNKLAVLEPCLSDKYGRLPFHTPPANVDALNVISVGRIIPEKGFDLIIKLANEHLKNSFFIVGAPEKDSVEFFNRLKDTAPPNVIFYGASHDIPSIIRENNITIAIIPSEWNEPFGIVAIELMMCSCLTFVRNRGGLKQIADNTGAILFDTDEKLKKLFEEVITESQAVRVKKAQSQYQKTRKYYAPEHFTERLKELLL